MSALLKDLQINPRYDLQAPYVLITYEQTATENGAAVLSLIYDIYAQPPGPDGNGLFQNGVAPRPPAGAQNQFNALRFTVDLQGLAATATKAVLACDYLDIENEAWWLKKHPARMSPALVRDLILAYSEWGDIVLDPFSGTGTTLEQAYLNQRYYLGMEKTEAFYQMCQRRVYEAEQEVMKRLAGI